jgi:hypothetical protein
MVHFSTLFLSCSGRKQFIKDIILVELQHVFDKHLYDHTSEHTEDATHLSYTPQERENSKQF